MIKVGLWGCGGISAMHRRAYKRLEDNGEAVKLVALCDINPENFTKEIKINLSGNENEPLAKIDNCYTDIDEMLANEDLDLVDICLPTFLHKESAIKVLEKGINVLLEKPMSLSSSECREILEAEKRSKGRLMVAQCERFTDACDYLKNVVESQKYGRLISADFSRLSQTPIWRFAGRECNKNKSDGVIFDMHIHDVDLVNYIFGVPEKIVAVSEKNTSYCDGVSTTFKYKSGFVNIRGDWGFPQSFPFEAKWCVSFEKGALVRDGSGKLTLYEDSGSTVIYETEGKEYFYEEIKYFTDIINKNLPNTKNPPESTLKTIELVEEIERVSEEI